MCECARMTLDGSPLVIGARTSPHWCGWLLDADRTLAGSRSQAIDHERMLCW